MCDSYVALFTSRSVCALLLLLAVLFTRLLGAAYISDGAGYPNFRSRTLSAGTANLAVHSVMISATVFGLRPKPGRSC